MKTRSSGIVTNINFADQSNFKDDQPYQKMIILPFIKPQGMFNLSSRLYNIFHFTALMKITVWLAHCAVQTQLAQSMLLSALSLQ